MNFDRTAYGKRVQALRKSKKITQEQLAEKLGISRSYMVKIELGSQTGPIELAVELGNIFGVSLNYLLLGTDELHTDIRIFLRQVIEFLVNLESEL